MDEVKTPGKVTQITEGRKKKGKSERDVKLKLAEVYRAISDSIRRAPFSPLPPFPLHYEVIQPERGARVPLLVADDDSVSISRPEALANDVLSYTETALGSRQDFCIEPRQAKAAAEYYLMSAKPIDPAEVALVRWADEPGLTYSRLPWKQEMGPAPTWEALLSRMTNAQAFIDWVGSLFYEKSYLQNYVWIYGRLGGDGKGAINRLLGKVFGSSYRSKQSPGYGERRDKFWTYGLLGARLVVFPDCDDPVFVTKGLFKSLTGGDATDIEAKGKMSFTAQLQAKFIIISNEWPALSLSPSDLRRIIFCELGASPGIDPAFETKLWQEGGAFLTVCVQSYLERYPDHGMITTESEAIEGLAATLDEDFDEVFSTWFEIDPMTGVEAHYMLDLVAAEWPKDRKQQHAFRRWLEKRHGIRKKRVRIGKELPWLYVGAKLLKIPPERSRIGGFYQEQLNKAPTDVHDLST